MFSIAQIREIRQWAIKHGVWNNKEGMVQKIAEHAGVVITDDALKSNGFDQALFFSTLEILVPKIVMGEKDSNVLAFMKLLATTLIKTVRSTYAMKQSIEADGDAAQIKMVDNWLNVQRNFLGSLLGLLKAYETGNHTAFPQLLLLYQAKFADFSRQTAELKKLEDHSVADLSAAILKHSQLVTHETFKVLGMPTTNEVTVDDKLAKMQPVEELSDTEVVGNQQPILQPSTSRKVLERSFEAARVQQFALSGHNFLLSCARPVAYVSKEKVYAANMSALLMSQQMVLSDRYIEEESKLKLADLEQARKFNGPEGDNSVNFDAILNTSLRELLPDAIKDADGKVNLEALARDLTGSLVKKLGNEAPNLANMLVSLSQREDLSLLSMLGDEFSKGLDDVLHKLPPPLQSLLGPVRPNIEGVVKDLFKPKSLEKLDQQLSKGLKEVGAFIGGDFKGLDTVFQNCDVMDVVNDLLESDLSIGSLAESLLGNVMGEEVEGIWKSFSQGLGGETFLDIGNGAVGVAINAFLPVVTKELFGDGDFANAANGAISGALTGMSVGGPVGALVGAGVGILSSLFGGDSEEAARAQQQQMQNMLEAVATDIKSYTGACFEQMDKRMMRRFDDVQTQMQTMAIDLHAAIADLGVHQFKNFERVFENLDDIRDRIEVNAKQMHEHLHEVSKYHQYRFDRLENAVYKVGDFLYEGIRDLQDLSKARFDRLEAITQQAFTMLDRKQEQRFSEQRKLLLQLRAEQKGEHGEVMDKLEWIKKYLSAFARMLYAQNQQIHARLSLVEGIMKTQPEIELASLRNKWDLEAQASVKILSKIKQLGSDLNNVKAFDLGQKIVFWGDVVQLYLHIVYHDTLEYFDNTKVREYTSALKKVGVRYQNDIAQLPANLSKQLFEYQRLIYRLYQSMTENYLAGLGKVAQQEVTAGAVEAMPIPAWSQFQNASIPSLNFQFKGPVATLSNAKDRQNIKILDVLNQDENETWIYVMEHDRLRLRLLDIEHATNLMDEAGENFDGLLRYPVILADYRKVSALKYKEKAATLLSYERYLNLWKNDTKHFNCSTEDYAVHGCDRGDVKMLYIWHPKKPCASITLPAAMGNIKSLNVKIKRDQLTVVALAGEAKGGAYPVWLGQWNLNTGAELIPCRRQTKLTMAAPTAANAYQFLREWGGWFVLGNSLLLDPNTLCVPSNQEIARYDGNQDHVRVAGDVYFDYAKQQFLPAVKPLLESSAKDQGGWVFHGHNLYLSCPMTSPIFSNYMMSQKRYFGYKKGFDIYADHQGEVLFLKRLSAQEKQLLAAQYEQHTAKANQDFAPVIQEKWLNPLLGKDLPGYDADDHASVIQLREFESKSLETLRSNLILLLITELDASPELPGLINLITEGEAKTLTRLLKVGMESKYLQWTMEKMRAFYVLQQHLFKLINSPESLSHYPVLSSNIEALDQLLSLQGENIVQPKWGKPLDFNNVPSQAQSVGLGLYVDLQRKTNKLFTLEVKVFGQSWSEYCRADRLFMERFHEEGQHRRALIQHLNELQVKIERECNCQFPQNWLQEQFFNQPDQALNIDVAIHAKLDPATALLRDRFFNKPVSRDAADKVRQQSNSFTFQ